ncbi:unnamed protein product [Pocillopora meandrina]|uniref:EF-hand domain-containing protein n=1 Tax=Pocillopora meandrina TaxID=46732 RepID=A0AAU9VZN0_9CNID|nr:unnamed protein product [Pocillopora meandrina]
MKSSKSVKSNGTNTHGIHGDTITATNLVDKPDILPIKKQAAKKAIYRRAITPLPPKTTSNAKPTSRPQTSLGLYNEKDGSFDVLSTESRPSSAFGFNSNNDRTASGHKISRLKGPQKGKSGVKSSQKYKKVPPKARVVWKDNAEQQGQATNTDAKSANADQPKLNGSGSNSLTPQTWARSSLDRERVLPRRRTGFNAGALIPGSVSTMVSLPETDENQNTASLASPSFQDILDHDASSEYDTDLEEDFPVPRKAFDPTGKNLYHKLCKEGDLVPVSFLSDRLNCQEVIMKHHGLGSQGTFPIARALIKNTFTEKLDLTDNYIEAAGGVALARMLLDNCYITEINLSENFLRSEGGLAFASMLLKNQSLVKLVLRSNHLGDKDAKAFADALRENRTLTYLDLSHNDIGEMGGIYLGAGLGMNYGLKHLDVSWNCIRFKGAVGMAQGLKTNDCLAHLNISWNGLSLLGCVALGRFLKKNEALESLDISNNRIGLLATQKLALGIAAHPNLKVLKIGKNPIGDGGVETLLNVIKAHRAIKFLSLEDITVSPKIYDEIKEIEKEKGVTIITGGIGGYKRPKEMPPGMRILLTFIQDNRLRLVDWFNQFDKDHSGGISREEFKIGLKETGLVMTQRQLDRLIDFIDINDDGEIEYSELMRGREITIQEIRQEKKIEERQRKFDEERMRLPKLEGYDYDLM